MIRAMIVCFCFSEFQLAYSQIPGITPPVARGDRIEWSPEMYETFTALLEQERTNAPTLYNLWQGHLVRRAGGSQEPPPISLLDFQKHLQKSYGEPPSRYGLPALSMDSLNLPLPGGSNRNKVYQEFARLYSEDKYTPFFKVVATNEWFQRAKSRYPDSVFDPLYDENDLARAYRSGPELLGSLQILDDTRDQVQGGRAGDLGIPVIPTFDEALNRRTIEPSIPGLPVVPTPQLGIDLDPLLIGGLGSGTLPDDPELQVLTAMADEVRQRERRYMDSPEMRAQREQQMRDALEAASDRALQERISRRWFADAKYRERARDYKSTKDMADAIEGVVLDPDNLEEIEDWLKVAREYMVHQKNFGRGGIKGREAVRLLRALTRLEKFANVARNVNHCRTDSVYKNLIRDAISAVDLNQVSICDASFRSLRSWAGLVDNQYSDVLSKAAHSSYRRTMDGYDHGYWGFEQEAYENTVVGAALGAWTTEFMIAPGAINAEALAGMEAGMISRFCPPQDAREVGWVCSDRLKSRLERERDKFIEARKNITPEQNLAMPDQDYRKRWNLNSAAGHIRSLFNGSADSSEIARRRSQVEASARAARDLVAGDPELAETATVLQGLESAFLAENLPSSKDPSVPGFKNIFNQVQLPHAKRTYMSQPTRDPTKKVKKTSYSCQRPNEKTKEEYNTVKNQFIEMTSSGLAFLVRTTKFVDDDLGIRALPEGGLTQTFKEWGGEITGDCRLRGWNSGAVSSINGDYIRRAAVAHVKKLRDDVDNLRQLRGAQYRHRQAHSKAPTVDLRWRGGGSAASEQDRLVALLETDAMAVGQALFNHPEQLGRRLCSALAEVKTREEDRKSPGIVTTIAGGTLMIAGATVAIASKGRDFGSSGFLVKAGAAIAVAGTAIGLSDAAYQTFVRYPRELDNLSRVLALEQKTEVHGLPREARQRVAQMYADAASDLENVRFERDMAQIMALVDLAGLPGIAAGRAVKLTSKNMTAAQKLRVLEESADFIPNFQKGMKLALNVGRKADGSVDPASVKLLRDIWQSPYARTQAGQYELKYFFSAIGEAGDSNLAKSAMQRLRSAVNSGRKADLVEIADDLKRFRESWIACAKRAATGGRGAQVLGQEVFAKSSSDYCGFGQKI